MLILASDSEDPEDILVLSESGKIGSGLGGIVASSEGGKTPK